MFREYNNQLKKYNFLQNLKEGDYLDAKDQQKWKVGKAKQFRKIGHKYTVTIQFDGFPAKYNQNYELPAYNDLAPFRKYSLPYTGRTLDAKRDQPRQSIEAYIKIMNKMAKNIDNEKSQCINQFIRGELFIFIDYILTRSSKLEYKNCYEDYVQVLLCYIDLFDKIFEKVFEFLKEIQKQGSLDQNYIYVHPKMALLYSLTEFLFNCNSLVSKKQQRITFHSMFSNQQPIQKIYATFFSKMQQINLQERCSKLVEFKCINKKTLPWSIKKQALILMKVFNPIQEFINPNQTKQIIQFLEYLPYFAKKGFISSQEGDRKYLDLIFTLVIKGNFEGKLIGLNEIKKRIPTSNYSSYSSSSSSLYSSRRDTMILDQIKQKNLIAFFLNNNNFNSELFKRALIIFEYGYKNGLFNKQNFGEVFKIHKDKHELQLVNFYNSLAEFSVFLSQMDVQLFLQGMIQELPFQQNFIDLVKNFTLNAINKNSAYKTHYMRNEQEGLGLIYFWQLINNQKKLNQQLISKVIEGFATLLNNSYYNKHIEQFVVSSIKGIKEPKNSESFLKVIHESLKLCKGNKMTQVIENAQKQLNIIETAMYVLKQQQNTLSPAGFQNLFEFLEEINAICRKGLTFNDILFIWKLNKSKCRTYLLKLLRKYKITEKDQKSVQKILNKVLDFSLIELLVSNVFQDDNLMESFKFIDEQHYQTIDELIIAYLHKKDFIQYGYKHTIRYNKNQIFVDQDKQFLGMKFYVKCIQNSENQEISIKATKRLIEIFLRPKQNKFQKNYNEIKLKNWIKVSNIFTSLKNNTLRCYSIQLQEIYGRMKSLNILDPDLIEIGVCIQNTNKFKILSVPRYTSLWKLRIEINDAFDLKDSNFNIFLTGNNTVTNLEREDDLSVAFINIQKQREAASVMIRLSNEIHPHYKVIDKFKQFLSEKIGDCLYNNLSSQNRIISQESLSILFKIPFLSSLEKKIEKPDRKNWDDILDKVNMTKLEYQLAIIQKVKNLKWVMEFIDKEGPKHLSEIILLNANKNSYRILNQCVRFLIETIKFQKDKIHINEEYLKKILIYEKETTDHYENYLNSCFTLTKQISQKIKLLTFFEKDNIAKILEIIVFTNKKTNIAEQLFHICHLHKLFDSLNKILKNFLTFTYLKQKMYQCRPFFEVIKYLIEKNLSVQISGSIQSIILQIRKSNICEQSENETNTLLYGYLLCLIQYQKQNRLNDVLYQSSQSFSNYLINQCLFNPNNISFRKFKSKELRQLGFNLLYSIDKDVRQGNKIHQALVPLISKGAWRKQFQWNISTVELVKKKYTGLKNLAATCYINSLLQQLYHIKSFSYELMNVDPDQIKDQQNIVREVQNIFGFLKYSQNTTCTTLSLCQNFILDGQPIDPRIQTDVDEFFHALMDKLERNLDKINKEGIINEVFRGQFSNLIIGQECPHTSERIEHFLSIRLQIKNKKNLYQAFDEFIKGEMLEGDNLYFCEKCDKKVKALKRVCLKDLPPVMLITLKRFQFDFDTMQKFKLNSYCSFPENINLLSYTKQGIELQSQQNSDQKLNMINRQKYEYKLKGVLIHYGISQAGHYTSYVKTEDHEWNYFDDERITEFDVKNLQKECFGGIQENPYGDDEEKKKNAYLLIYEKVQSEKPEHQITELELKKTKVHKFVEEDNLKNRSVNILFEKNIQNYLYRTSETNPMTFLVFYHNVFLRNSSKHEKFFEFYTKARQLLQKKPVSQWYLSQINPAFLLEFVIHGDYQVKHLVVSLICQSMRNCFDKQFLMQCISLLYTKSLIPFVKIFSVASMINQYAKELNSCNFTEVIVNLIKGKQIKQNNFIYKVQIRKQMLEFGLTASGFVENIKNFDSKDFFRAIEELKVHLISLDEIRMFAQEIRNQRTQRSLALIVARKFKDLESMNKILESYLTREFLEFEINRVREEFYFNFLIFVVEEFMKIKDNDQQKRCIILTKLYLQAIKDALNGFKCELMLINGLFRIWLSNNVFRQIIHSLLSTNKELKKIMMSLKDWIKQTQNLIPMITCNKWSWWRKIKKNYPGLTQKEVDIQIIPPVKQFNTLINAIVEKQNIQPVPVYFESGDYGYINQNNEPDKVKILRKLGYLMEIEDSQENKRYVSEDQISKKFL